MIVRIHICLFLFGLLIFTQANAQIITDKTSFDFGEVGKDDQHYVDFQLTNASNSDIRIIKHEAPYGISVRFSDKIIKPDESVYVRIKYTPKRKGPFEGDVPLWVSSNNEPIVLSIRGKATSFNQNESLDVPDFKQKTEKHLAESAPLKLKVVRKSDGSPVEGAQIDIIWDGVMYRSLATNLNGQSESGLVPDNYYIVAQADGLGEYEASIEVLDGGSKLTIELGPEGTLTSVDEDSVVVAVIEEPEPEPVAIIEPIEEPSKDPEVVPEPPEPKPVKPKDENPDFPDDDYVPNNIVFLIDVSISMKQQGRMELLKASMIELTNLLRSRDKVAIVTYSSRAVIALKSTPASNKSEIIDVIKSLEPKGSTSGERGIKKAYSVLEDNVIPGGNNQVFISTDGAFNLDKQDKALIEMVRKNSSKGYKISVIGIRNSLGTVKNMKQIAEEGNGNYLHINNYSSARRTLVEEIKLQSRNHK